MILDIIVKATKIRVDEAKMRLPLSELKKLILEEDEHNPEAAYQGVPVERKIRSFHCREAFAFEKALRKNRMAFICEVKKASPSKGVIAKEFPYLNIAREYEDAGADAISVLTEPDYFQGSNRYLEDISRMVSIPVLRKDFIIEEYQIYEAKLIGADALLLICSLLEEDTIKEFLSICDTLGLSALVEAHTEEEVHKAIRAGARIIGVNNRNLQTFEVDLNHSIKLRDMVPEEIIFVAESGIRSAGDINCLRKSGVNAVLIGEALMRSENKKELLTNLYDTGTNFKE